MKYYSINGLLCQAESKYEAYMNCAKHSYETHNDGGDFSGTLSPGIYSNEDKIFEINDSISNDDFSAIAEAVSEKYNSEIEYTNGGWSVVIANTRNTFASLTYDDVYDMMGEKTITFNIMITRSNKSTYDKFYALDNFDSIDAIMSWIDNKVNEYTQTVEYKADEKSREELLNSICEDAVRASSNWNSVNDKLPKNDEVCCAYGSKITKDQRNKIYEKPLFAFATYDKKNRKWNILSEGVTKNPFNSKKEETLYCITHWCHSTHKVGDFI